MSIYVAPSKGKMSKFLAVKETFPNVWNGSVLDVGCRTGELKQALSGTVSEYCGLDIFPPADVIATLENTLPFPECRFDTVVALDVLEHTNDFHLAFSELCRVTRYNIIISVPNCFEITMRLKFLIGKPTCGKYGLPIEPQLDRHRWFFSFDDAEHFFSNVSPHYGFKLVESGGLIGPKRGSGINRLLSARFPSVFAPTYLALLQKDN